MKKKSIIIALAMTLIIGTGATAYAASNSSTLNNRTCTSMGSGMGIGRMTNFSGRDILDNLLESKGVTENEITTALNSGKSRYDLLKEKGVSDEDIKSYMLNEKTNGIDKAVSEGAITKEQGEEMKTNIKENSADCTPGQGNGIMRGQGNGKGKGMRTR